jgi:hypothetical protein
LLEGIEERIIEELQDAQLTERVRKTHQWIKYVSDDFTIKIDTFAFSSGILKELQELEKDVERSLGVDSDTMQDLRRLITYAEGK